MLTVVLEIKKINKNFTSWSTRRCPTGAHSVYPIAMKLLQVVGYMLAVVLENEENLNCTSCSILCCPTF